MKIDGFAKRRHPGESRGPKICNLLKRLDSGFRRNDEIMPYFTFCECIKIRRLIDEIYRTEFHNHALKVANLLVQGGEIEATGF